VASQRTASFAPIPLIVSEKLVARPFFSASEQQAVTLAAVRYANLGIFLIVFMTNSWRTGNCILMMDDHVWI